MAQQGWYIGELSTRSGVPAKTIRYYEDVGLLGKPERTDSGYRVYAPDAAERLLFIKKAQGLGLRLDEIKEILNLADRGRCPCGHVQKLLKVRLKELRQKIADLKLVEARVEKAVRRGCPPNYKPKGSAICPTIQRQSLPKRKDGRS